MKLWTLVENVDLKNKFNLIIQYNKFKTFVIPAFIKQQNKCFKYASKVKFTRIKIKKLKIILIILTGLPKIGMRKLVIGCLGHASLKFRSFRSRCLEFFFFFLPCIGPSRSLIRLLFIRGISTHYGDDSESAYFTDFIMSGRGQTERLLLV